MKEILKATLMMIDELIAKPELENNLHLLKKIRTNYELVYYNNYSKEISDENFEDYNSFISRISEKIMNNDECFDILQNLLAKIAEID